MRIGGLEICPRTLACWPTFVNQRTPAICRSCCLSRRDVNGGDEWWGDGWKNEGNFVAGQRFCTGQLIHRLGARARDVKTSARCGHAPGRRHRTSWPCIGMVREGISMPQDTVLAAMKLWRRASRLKSSALENLPQTLVCQNESTYREILRRVDTRRDAGNR